MRRRYQSNVTVGRITTTIDFEHLADAEAMQDRYRSKHRLNRNAYGGIYDRVVSRYVRTASWRGGIPRPQLPTIAEIFEKLIARGEPVSIIGPCGAAHFNEERADG